MSVYALKGKFIKVFHFSRFQCAPSFVAQGISRQYSTCFHAVGSDDYHTVHYLLPDMICILNFLSVNKNIAMFLGKKARRYIFLKIIEL